MKDLMPGILICSLLASQFASASEIAPAIDRLESALPELMRQADVPGLSLALIRDGRTWVRGFGVTRHFAGQRVTADTIFEAASLGKPVFAYAVLKLAEQGRIDLDSPLANYLPNPYISADIRLAKITARIVLSHRSGFPNWRGDADLTIHFTPGERFSYSGEGMIYLQKVVECITGQPLNQVMDQIVFQPLGMTRSSYVWRPDFDEWTASGHGVNPELIIPKWKPQVARAAASLNTTASDYARFIHAILSGAGLKPETLRQMETPEIAVDPSCVTNCFGPKPQNLSKEIFWGLGWGIERTDLGNALWHWGDNGSFKAYVVVYPAKQMALVMFANSISGLSIANEVTRLALGGNQPGLTWLNVDSYDSEPMRFARELESKEGAAAAIARFRSAFARGIISAKSADAIGQVLLDEGKAAEAIQVFKVNVEFNPRFSKSYDHMAQAYEARKNIEAAIPSYRKALQLDKDDAIAQASLYRLGVGER